MKNKRIGVNYGRTVNVGNFEGVRLDANAAGDLEPGEDKEEAYAELWKEVKGQVRRKIKRIRERAGED